MDISFMTNAGGDNNWSLDECARWAKEHDFDCVRLGDIGGAIDSDKILTEGPDETLETLKKYAIHHGRDWEITVEHLELVKWYSPHVRHVVLDVKCS